MGARRERHHAHLDRAEVDDDADRDGITEKLGGLLPLTAVLVVSTGILGAVMAKYVLDALRIRDHGVRGFAVGVAAHGIGTARAFQVSEQAGAFAGLGMGLNGLATAILFPLVLWLAGWR